MIKIENIDVSYGKKKVLDDVSINFEKSEFTFLLGPNGAGKSTLLKSINGIVKTTKGQILIDDESEIKHKKDFSEKELAKQIAFIPQEFAMHFDFSVYDFLLMARYPWLNFWSHYSDYDHKIVEKYLIILGLERFKNRFFKQLSGGEKQRVLIARALVQETKCILMDESLSFLDINHQIEILRLLQYIKKNEKKTIVMVSHNLNLAAEFAERLIILKEGKIIAKGTSNAIFNSTVLKETFDMEFSMIINPFTGVSNIIYKP